jgi:hypothetical protein
VHLLFLGVDTEHRNAAPTRQAAQSGDVAELLRARRRINHAGDQLLAQRTAAKAGPMQQRGDRVATDLEPALEQARQALLARARFRATWCPNSPWVICRRDATGSRA